MSTFMAWVDDPSGESRPDDISREEFDMIRRRQEDLMERVRFVEEQVKALTARVDEDEDA